MEIVWKIAAVLLYFLHLASALANLHLDFGSTKYPVTLKVTEFLKRIDQSLLSRVPGLSIGVGDGIALLIMAVSFAYIFQFLLGRLTNSYDENASERSEQIFMLRGLNCLTSETELAFDNCVARSACESPSRAMSLVTAASLVTGTSSKYSGLVSLVRDAAQHGLGGGDCNTL